MAATTADQALLDAAAAAAGPFGGEDTDAFAAAAAAAPSSSSSPKRHPGLSLNARGALKRFELRHTWPLPSVADGLSASVGVRYDPDLQRRGGGLLQQLGLAPKTSPGQADGAQLTAALVWRSRDGLSRLSVSDAEMAAKRGWKFSAGPVTGILGAELRYPLLGTAAARRDPLTGYALPSTAPDLPRVLSPGAADPDLQRQRAPKVSFSVDDVKPLWAYAAAVGAAVLLGAPVSLCGQNVSVGLPGGKTGLPRRLAARVRGSARHHGWLNYAVDVDEVGGALEIGPLLKLGGGGRKKTGGDDA